MKKFFCLCLAICSLSGCATLHNKLADASVLKYKLADGKTVYVDTNVVPSAAWRCREVGTPLVRTWGSMKLRGQFSFSGAQGYFTQKAIDSANEQRLKTNYINLTIPRQVSIGGFNLHPYAKATATYYQCRQINPDHELGGKHAVGVSF